LQIAGLGFVGANANGRCAQIALIGLTPPYAVIPLDPQPVCNGGTFSTKWTYGSNETGPCSPVSVVVTATDTDPATPVIGSQATQVTVCAASPPCGDLGLPVCNGQPCFTGSAAVDGTCECGSRNQACCNSSQCTAGTSCIDGTCQCGGPGQPCCSGGCNANLSCIAGAGGAPTCSCGTAPLPCCNGTTCGAGLVCLQGAQCVTCGQINGPCCTGDQCSSGLACSGSGGTCQCGNPGQPCCANNSCNTSNHPNLGCVNSTCVYSGSPAPACQAVGASCGTSTGPFCCNETSVRCNYGTCTACVAHSGSCTQDTICCNASDMCVADSNLSGQFVCDIPDAPPCGAGYPAPCPPTPQTKGHPQPNKPRATPPAPKP
jgi:hypothetical protein